MAGERELAERGEDPDPGVSPLLRRQDEDRLGEVHLAGERLHPPGVEPAPVGEDGELVALQRRFGEDVEEDVGQRALLGPDCRARPSARAAARRSKSTLIAAEPTLRRSLLPADLAAAVQGRGQVCGGGASSSSRRMDAGPGRVAGSPRPENCSSSREWVRDQARLGGAGLSRNAETSSKRSCGNET